jgi:hypothetical protein
MTNRLLLRDLGRNDIDNQSHVSESGTGVKSLLKGQLGGKQASKLKPLSSTPEDPT